MTNKQYTIEQNSETLSFHRYPPVRPPLVHVHCAMSCVLPESRVITVTVHTCTLQYTTAPDVSLPAASSFARHIGSISIDQHNLRDGQ